MFARVRYSETNGGITNMSRMIEYREAFVKSLRAYARPVSAYTKIGGRSGVGYKRNASVTPGAPSINSLNTPFTISHADLNKSHDYSPCRPKKDVLVESQLHFEPKYAALQSKIRVM